MKKNKKKKKKKKKTEFPVTEEVSWRKMKPADARDRVDDCLERLERAEDWTRPLPGFTHAEVGAANFHLGKIVVMR